MSESWWVRCRRWVGTIAGNRDGVTAIEYGLIAAAIAVALVAVVILLGGEIGNMFGTVSSSVGEVANSS